MKRRTWKPKDRGKFQQEAIKIIEEHDPHAIMVNTITGKIFDTLVFDYKEEE